MMQDIIKKFKFIAARHHQHFRRADLARVDTRLQRGESRIEAALKTDHADHARASTASAQARARSSVRSTGFSQNTCFFCAADFRIRSACVSVLEQITVAPIDASPIAPSISATCAPCWAASAAAASLFTSTTYLSRTPGCRARFAA